jgi:murein DD-endopeptidase MepM/ murein hydrolase activator NlpD
MGFPSAVPVLTNITPTATQVVISVPTLAPTLPPGLLPTLTPRVSPTPTLMPGDHLWFWKPFARDITGQIKDFASRGYAYGSTANGLQLHHGIDIENPTGTPVQSIGSGRVFYAGGDQQVQFGPAFDFYGNVVVIEHDYLAPDGRKIYSLYGHLSRVLVATGDAVGFGSQIGSVGAEGVALGAHLHLEIRLGDPYDYYSTYNPELWIYPWEGYGIFAARVTGPDGQLVPNVRIELIGGGAYLAGTSYASDLVNPDPYYGENLVIGDIRAGQYDFKVGEIRDVLYRGVVQIEAGRVTLVNVQLATLPPPPPTPFGR